MRKILIAIAITLLVLFLADQFAHQFASGFVPRQVMRRITSAPSTIDVLGIGNSLMAAGFDATVIEQRFGWENRRIVAVNGGLGSTGIIEHLLLTRLALGHHTVRTVVYGFFDQQLTGDLIPYANSELIGNRSMLYYVEPQLALKYARFGPVDVLLFQTYRCCALLRERGAIWERVEKLRRTMQEVGMPHLETNQFGRRADFSQLEATSIDSFARSCREVIRSGNFLSATLQALLQQARDHGAEVIVVEMPMHPQHVTMFYGQAIWETYRSQNQNAIERAGAAYVNASRWVPGESLFADHLHLSNAGAAQFSRMLAEYLISRKAAGQSAQGIR